MNIVSLFGSFVNHINNFLDKKLNFYQLEHDIFSSTDVLNINILKDILEFIDLDYKNSIDRKKLYHVQNTRQRKLITYLGEVTFNMTYYKSKHKINGKYIFYSFITDHLNLDKWAKMTLAAEVKLINHSINYGSLNASIDAIPNCYISRQTISKKIKSINYNYIENVNKINTPVTLYIEADEVHSNLQSKKNKIVPVILTHEGHKEDFANRKQLKNKHYIASSILNTDKLWNETYKYLDSKYDLNKVDYLFISGDGGSWIKGYDEAFPNAIFVLDKFHYRKALNYIFKKDSSTAFIADSYLRNKMIDEFKQLVKLQITLYPHQEKYLIQKQNYLINNIVGIINQFHPMYKCPCSMEGHISNYYANHLTSRPHAYSDDGLENTVQLLTMKANNIELTEQIYWNFKHKDSTYKQLNLEKYITNFKNLSKQYINPDLKYLNNNYSIDTSSFTSYDKYRSDYYLNHRL